MSRTAIKFEKNRLKIVGGVVQTQATHYLFTLQLRLNNDYGEFAKEKYQK